MTNLVRRIILFLEDNQEVLMMGRMGIFVLVRLTGRTDWHNLHSKKVVSDEALTQPIDLAKELERKLVKPQDLWLKRAGFIRTPNPPGGGDKLSIWVGIFTLKNLILLYPRICTLGLKTICQEPTKISQFSSYSQIVIRILFKSVINIIGCWFFLSSPPIPVAHRDKYPHWVGLLGQRFGYTTN